jgi:predicted enzyme related to lactoylglutathione lyase
MPNPVVHFEINAKDGKKLNTFYSSLFDWKIDSNNPMNYGMVTTGDKGVQGGIGQSDGNSPQYVTIYIEVDDLQKYLNKAEKLGGKTVVPPMEIPNVVTFAQFVDPEGNLIGLVKQQK